MTKRQEKRSTLTTKLTRGGAAVAALGIAGALAMGLASCDTVAVISFPQRSFTGIHTSGFTPVPEATDNIDDLMASCRGVDSTDVEASSGDMKLRFVLTDNHKKPIRAGETVDDISVEFDTRDLNFSNSALTQVMRGNSCASDADCASGFSCGMAPGLESAGANQSLQTCYRVEENGLEHESDIDFIADTDAHQVFGMLAQNSGSLHGWNPPGIENEARAYDSDGDGVTDTQTQAGLIGGPLATDPERSRTGAISSLFDPWLQTALVARKDRERKTFFGLWTFAGGGVNKMGPENLQWLNDPVAVSSALDEYRQKSVNETRANVYEALKELIGDNFDQAAMTNTVGQSGHPDKVEKILTVFVDGPDEVRERDNATIEQVIEAAVTNNVRVFIVHLDARIGDPTQLREDPTYHENQDKCDDDSDCKNYETCRRPRGYAASVGDATDFAAEDTYCMLDRDVPTCSVQDCPEEWQNATGRLGPIEDYATLGCATGGGYMYVPSPSALTRNIEWTPYALEGLWETEVHSRQIKRGNVPADGELGIHSDMNINVSGTDRVYPFNQLGRTAGGTDSISEDFDTRGVIFTRE